MSFIQPSIEGSPLSNQDPWDWTVDQVVFALTDHGSPLIQANEQLSLPDASLLAKVLRENDVTGLALLTEVTTHCLRDELGIKSLGHRAAINHLIRQLQDVSSKFQQQTQRSARLSSASFASRVGTPYFATPLSYEPGAASRAPGSTFSPLGSSARPHEHLWLDQPFVRLRNVLEVGPEVHQLDQPNELAIRSLGDVQNDEGLGINITNGTLNEVEPEKTMSSPGAIASSHEEPSTHNARNSYDAQRAEPEARQGETIIIDETGKKRRHLVIAQPSTSEPMQTLLAKSPALDEPPSSPETLRKDTNANPSFESNHFGASDCSIFDEKHSPNNQEPSGYVQAVTSMLDVAIDLGEAAVEPGTLLKDKDGRKRMRPILIHQGDLDSAEPVPSTSISNRANDILDLDSLDLQTMKITKHVQQRSYGKRATRRADQVYLGFDSMPVDILIYGDIALDEVLDTGQTALKWPPPDFSITPRTDVGKGQRLYVNARMRYFLHRRKISLKRDGRHHIGVFPYPETIGRRNHPLSITVFSPSSHGVTATRANRSQWVEEKVAPNITEVGSNEGNIFNVADPALIRNEREDPEWKGLEKWNFVDGVETLPAFGESGSDGEYDSETWREIEKEQENNAQPLDPSKIGKLSGAEVQGAIDVAIEQTVKDWSIKRLPKLELKGWRLWVKSRRNRNLQDQIEVFTHNLEHLEARIASLRKEIAHEEWSKTSQINKQCRIIQPSIFDREDCKWKIALLKLQKAPEKPPLANTKPKPVKSQRPAGGLKDGEEILTECSDSSEDNLDDFIVEDDAEGDTYQPVVVDDDLTMADVEDGIDSDILVVRETPPKTPPKLVREFRQPIPSPSNIIDLTQQSDPVEPEDFAPKSERCCAIKTPPLYSSENDSEIFQRSRSKKPVFKIPPTVPTSPPKATAIISLESDSSHSERNTVPALTDVEGIKAMDAADLVERQDRKRLLIWTIAHTPAPGRRAAFSCLNKTSMEASHAYVTSGLRELLHRKRRVRFTDTTDSDGVMRIASWHVCWTIPVKVSSEGLQIPHIITTLEDDGGYEPFYYFLLECSKYYQKVPSLPSQSTPKKKRQIISREDSDDERLLDSQSRKRKYFVPESQETLDKRHAAQDRLRANEERRRREELKIRFTRMGTNSADTSKVVVNPGKLADQDFIYLNPRFGNGARIKPHQEEGLQFLWREITSEHEDLQGCLLAQTMGLGKTMQVIALLVTLSEAARSSNQNVRDQVPPSLRETRTLILCPPALIENWWDEFLLWPPLPLSENIGGLRKVNSAMNQADRLIEIHAWSKTGGVLLLGFEAFKSLIHNTPRINTKTKEQKATLDNQQHEMVKQALLQRPTLVVADEAHQFKTKNSSINLAMNQIKTKSRIALTGSPLSNNLGEYHSLIDWIAPGYLGNSTEFKATYEEPIREGLYQDSTDSQYRESRKRLKALELELEPKVHRANESCLHAELKGKSEFVIRVPLTDVQRKLYCICTNTMVNATIGKEPGTVTLWSWLNILKLLCNHPKCYMEKLLETGGPASQKTKGRKSIADETLGASEDDVAISDEPVSCAALSQIRRESHVVFESLTEPIDTLSLSHKVQVLMNILTFSQDAHDKVLVFSHSLSTLDYIGEQLQKMHQEFVRVDGKVIPQKRQSMTKMFNEGEANICLISTKAGGQGLNFYGANRVVILDDHFNPQWEMQAIGRAYRIGQQKTVYVYRLTVGGTFEQAIQNQALFKEQLATRVVDKKNPNRSALKSAGHYLFPPKTVDQEDLTPFLGKDPLVLDRLLVAQPQSENLRPYQGVPSEPSCRDHILSITPSETFHIEDGFELTAAEKMEAEQMQREEQMRRRDPKAHTAMILERREKGLRQNQSYVASLSIPPTANVRPIPSTQQVLGTVATERMPSPPSTAPNATLGSGGMLDPTSTASPSVSVLIPTTSNAGNGAVVPETTVPQPGLDTSRRLSRTPEFNISDLQSHVDNSITFVPKHHSPRSEATLREAIDDLFGEGPLDGSSPNKKLVPIALKRATREDFEAIMSRKCSEDKYEHIPDAVRLDYARALRSFIVQKAKTQEEYHRLAAGLRHLLDKESLNPKALLAILRDKIQPARPQAPIDLTIGGPVQVDGIVSGQPDQLDGQAGEVFHAAEGRSVHHTNGSGHVNGINGHDTELNGMKRGPPKNNRTRKRSPSADDEHPKKKTKTFMQKLPFGEAMEKTFENLLSREAGRSSKRAS